MKEGWTLDVITKAPIEKVNSNVGLLNLSLSFSRVFYMAYYEELTNSINEREEKHEHF